MNELNSIYLNFLFVLIISYFIFGLLRFINKFLLFIVLVIAVSIYWFSSSSFKQKLDLKTKEIIISTFKLDNINAGSKIKKPKAISIEEKIKNVYSNIENEIKQQVKGK